MRIIKTILMGASVVLLLVAVATPILLAPGPIAATAPAMPPSAAEQAAIIEAMSPPKRARPVIAVIARNEGTEVADFLTINGVLRRADIADVTIVAQRDEPIRLYPSDITVKPEMTAAAFEARYPEGADYVVIPAMDPGTDPFVAGWIAAQHHKGAKIVSVCNGSRVLSTAGLLDGRRATAHWSAVAELRRKHPTMEWVPDRRYVTDNGVTSSTGITASIPTMLALVEAIAGRERAAAVAAHIGVDGWDARHHSANFELTLEHMKTFVRNTLSFWRREKVGVPVTEGVDELALGLTLDAYSRTQLTSAVAVGPEGRAVHTAHGLVLYTAQAQGDAKVDWMVPQLPTTTPSTLIDRHLADIAARYDRSTAGIVSLVMEYPWESERGPD